MIRTALNEYAKAAGFELLQETPASAMFVKVVPDHMNHPLGTFLRVVLTNDDGTDIPKPGEPCVLGLYPADETTDQGVQITFRNPLAAIDWARKLPTHGKEDA